jgi:DNA-binding IclR family transcriptional regulator
MLTRQCEGASWSRAEAVAANLEKGEWFLRELARYLGMPQATLHRSL